MTDFWTELKLYVSESSYMAYEGYRASSLNYNMEVQKKERGKKKKIVF